MSLIDEYTTQAQLVLQAIVAGQRGHIDRAAEAIADAIGRGGIIQAFATGHSRSVALELVGRAGGLVPANQLGIRDLAYYGDTPIVELLDPKTERHDGLARSILDLAQLHPADVFVIISNSGRNAAITEMAAIARQNSHPVVAITSTAHRSMLGMPSDDTQDLAALADVVIDTGVSYGDAVLEAGGEQVVGLSTLAGVFVAQLLTAATIERLVAAGSAPPVFRSANIPGNDQGNDDALAGYAGRVRLGDA